MSKTLWDGYERHVRLFDPLLVEIGENGIPVDEDARKKLDIFFTQELIRLAGEIQDVYPNELKNIHPKKGFANPPKEKECAIRFAGETPEWFDKEYEIWRPMELRRFTKLEIKKQRECICYTLQETSKNGKPLKKPKKLWADICSRCEGKHKYTEIITEQDRWCQVLPFKPSNDQLVRYMNFRGHKVPKAKKRNDAGVRADTSNREALLDLAAKYNDPLYLRVNEYREVEKAQATYVLGWKPTWDADRGMNLVHPQFFKATATGQKNSKGPNAQNFPKHKRFAKELRKMIAAPAGYRLLELDCKAFHALTTGYEARDLSYMRLARLDIHSFFTARLIKQPADLSKSDAELGEYLGWVKKNHKVLRDTKAKPSILAWGFGAQPPTVFNLNRQSFESVTEVETLWKELERTFPRVAAWQKAVTLRAHSAGVLVSQHGDCRRFYEVYKYRLEPCKVCHGFECDRCDQKNLGYQWIAAHGSDYEDAIAFLPSNSAHGHFDDMMIELRSQGLTGPWSRILGNEQAEHWEDGIWLINNIHDALQFLVRSDKVDAFLPRIAGIMEAPSKTLVHQDIAPDGLWVEVESMISKDGGNWLEMEVLDMKTGMAAKQAA